MHPAFLWHTQSMNLHEMHCRIYCRLTITEVHARAPYMPDVTFSDGTRKRINIESLLWGPVFAPVRNPDEFRRAFVGEVLDTVAWPSGADLAPEALYELPEVELAGG